MTAYTLPKSALIDKFIPKTVIFDKAESNYKVREEFSKYIQRITWKYKLAESTVWIHKWSKAEEIQIFEIQLKEREIPKNVLSVIDRIIPYPILFECVFKDDVAYVIKHEKEYFISDWNPDIEFELNWVNLDRVYEKIVSKFVLWNDIWDGDVEFNDTIERHRKVEELKKDIDKLENKIKKEVQFNRKVPLNMEIHKKKKELDKLLSLHKEEKRLDKLLSLHK